MFEMKGDEVCINIFELIHDHFPQERLMELAESIGCADTVINAVADQLLGGWTENGFCGFTGTDNTPIDKGRRKIAEGANEAARTEIRRLESKLEFSEKTKDEYMNKYFELYHMGYQPELP